MQAPHDIRFFPIIFNQILVTPEGGSPAYIFLVLAVKEGTHGKESSLQLRAHTENGTYRVNLRDIANTSEKLSNFQPTIMPANMNCPL